MWFTIPDLAQAVWPWLPEATIALRFATALIGFIIALPLLVHRIRRWTRPRR